RLSLGDVVRGLWPQTVFGLALGLAILFGSGAGTLVWAAPMLLGLTLSIPLAVLTANPGFGAWAARWRLCAIPDEVARPEPIARIEARSEQAPHAATPVAA
ncbi:MAG: glucans biosynthesis glucosyltransferase MdoH, partial [Pseudomonadota bacterium]